MAIQKCEKRSRRHLFYDYSVAILYYSITEFTVYENYSKRNVSLIRNNIWIPPRKINWWFWRENSNETFSARCHLALKLLIHYYWLHTPAVLYSKFRRKYLEYRETKEEIKGDFMPIQYIVLRVITSSYMWPRFTMPFWHKSAFDGKVPVYFWYYLSLFSIKSSHIFCVSRFH